MPTKMVVDNQGTVATVDLLWHYRTHTHACMHACTHARAHTHTYTHTHTHTHTHTKLHGYGCIYDDGMASLILLNHMFAEQQPSVLCV